MKVESLCPFCCFFFLLLLFSSVLDVSVSSKVSRSAITAPFRLICLWQEFPKSLYRRMFMNFRSHLQMSLNRSCGLPAGRFPSASSPHRMSFGILPSSILQTCPSHRMRRCFNREYMLGRFALSRTSVPGTLSCQAMFKMRRRLRRWKVLSLCSCNACSTQDLLPYRDVLSTHALYT